MLYFQYLARIIARQKVLKYNGIGRRVPNDRPVHATEIGVEFDLVSVFFKKFIASARDYRKQTAFRLKAAYSRKIAFGNSVLAGKSSVKIGANKYSAVFSHIVTACLLISGILYFYNDNCVLTNCVLFVKTRGKALWQKTFRNYEIILDLSAKI